MLKDKVGPPISGIKDGGHIVLSCSACGEGLVDIWVTRPDDPIPWKVQAICCYCGDKSYVSEFHGRFHFGGYGINQADDTENAKMFTSVVGTPEEVGDKLVFQTKKVT